MPQDDRAAGAELEEVVRVLARLVRGAYPKWTRAQRQEALAHLRLLVELTQPPAERRPH